MHAVGPIWHGGKEGEEILLGMTVRSCLEKATELKCKSISLPAISSGDFLQFCSIFIYFLGIFGFPKEKCATIMFEMAQNYVKEMAGKTPLTEIRFTNFDDKTVELFDKECKRLLASKTT